MFRTGLTALLAVSLGLTGCATTAEEEEAASGNSAIVSAKADDHWFYAGPLPALADAAVTVSLAGHTARVTGTLPAGTRLPDLPHVKTKAEGDKLRVDIVYPIATARPGKSNSRPGSYSFYEAKPYRPNGAAFTRAEGWHQVPWGGFPFLGYNNGIAFHGPITDKDNESPDDVEVWYLRRGRVSGGCNRMLGEHVVELAHLVGISMRKIYEPNKPYEPTTTASVRVIADYDTLDGKYIDVDYPTDAGAERPGTKHGAESVVMFGSWVLSEMPDGKDLPADMKWLGGAEGSLYDFQAHAVSSSNWVCSMPKSSLGELKTIAERMGGELPADFCAKKRACDASQSRVCKASEIQL
jgi:hypothetical protein